MVGDVPETHRDQDLKPPCLPSWLWAGPILGVFQKKPVDMTEPLLRGMAVNPLVKQMLAHLRCKDAPIRGKRPAPTGFYWFLLLSDGFRSFKTI